jgi:ubiquinone/menaquinone biosynthesis C-methylase UbiE
MSLSRESRETQNAQRIRAWRKQADSYDRLISWWERRMFGEDNRPWACSRAEGRVLEVAVGTGLNIPFYDAGLTLVGVDLSPDMLAIARQRALAAGRDIDLRVGDAHDLDFEDASFDSVVCTFSLCNIPDTDRALGEIHRVLRPGGRLILVDHIRSSVRPVLWVQKVAELLTIRLDGDHLTRRPSQGVERLGFEITESERFAWGVVERLVAMKTPSLG